MKQLIYGPSGYGKSHMILHSLPEKKVVYITTNGIRQEFDCVGLNLKLLSVKTIPLSVKENKHATDITLEIPYDFKKEDCKFIGFETNTIPYEYEEDAINTIIKWLEKEKITGDSEYIIIFSSIFKEISNRNFIDRIERWDASVIIEHCCENKAIKYVPELQHIATSDRWLHMAVFTEQKPNLLFKNMALLEQYKAENHSEEKLRAICKEKSDTLHADEVLNCVYCNTPVYNANGKYKNEIKETLKEVSVYKVINPDPYQKCEAVFIEPAKATSFGRECYYCIFKDRISHIGKFIINGQQKYIWLEKPISELELEEGKSYILQLCKVESTFNRRCPGTTYKCSNADIYDTLCMHRVCQVSPQKENTYEKMD